MSDTNDRSTTSSAHFDESAKKQGGQVFGYSSYPPVFPKDGTKCDICGSTAVDHTEMQCQINRLSRRPSNPTKEKTDATKD